MVYIVTDGTGYGKIGVAENLDSRIKGLQTGNPRRIEKLKVIETNSRDGDFELEKRLHRRYKGAMVYINGEPTEWFLLDEIQELVVGDKWQVDDIAIEERFYKVGKVTSYGAARRTPIKPLWEYLDARTANYISWAGIQSFEGLQEFMKRHRIPGCSEKRYQYIQEALEMYRMRKDKKATIYKYKENVPVRAATLTSTGDYTTP